MSVLSVKRIEAEKPDPLKDRRVADGLGLYLKVAKTGTKTFTYRFTYASGRQEMTLGTFPELSLVEAREARHEAAKILETGKNPLHAKQSTRQAKVEALTVAELIEEFKKEYLDLKFEKPEAAYQCLTRDIGKSMGKLLLPDVTKRDVVDAINKIVRRGSRVAANRTLTLTKLLFQYAVDQTMIEISPVVLTRKGAGGKEKAKTTNLTFEEIAEFMKVMDREDLRLAIETRDALRLTLATGKRPGEVSTIEWKHVDLDKGVWINPRDLTKEKRDNHTVFLNPYAVRLLRRVQERSGRRRHVFASPVHPETHIDRHSMSRAVLRLFNEEVLKVRFTPHDFRRTYSSRMADLGQMPHVVEKTLDHMMEGVMAVYNRATYLPERQAAMNIWGAKLEELSKQ